MRDTFEHKYIPLSVCIIISNRTLGQRALEAGAGAGVSCDLQAPQRTSLVPLSSILSFHCFVNLFSFLAKLTIYKAFISGKPS